MLLFEIRRSEASKSRSVRKVGLSSIFSQKITFASCCYRRKIRPLFSAPENQHIRQRTSIVIKQRPFVLNCFLFSVPTRPLFCRLRNVYLVNNSDLRRAISVVLKRIVLTALVCRRLVIAAALVRARLCDVRNVGGHQNRFLFPLVRKFEASFLSDCRNYENMCGFTARQRSRACIARPAAMADARRKNAVT